MQMMKYPKKYLAKSILKKYLEDTIFILYLQDTFQKYLHLVSSKYFFSVSSSCIFKILFKSILHNTAQSAIVGLRVVLKFGLDRIHRFGDIVIFIF